MRPTDFAGQLNVSLANGWGIVRSVTDMCMKLPEGKYVLVKDPNKVCIPSIVCFRSFLLSVSAFPQPVIRLYAVPASAFTGDDDEEYYEETGEVTA